MWRSACSCVALGVLLVVACTCADETGAPGATSAGTGGTAGSTGVGGSAGAPLGCDPGFAFDPDPPETGAAVTVSFTDDEPLSDVGLDATGPATATVTWAGITTADPWTWNWSVTGLAAGLWTFTFSAGDPQQPLASCQRVAIDTGPPPPPVGCNGKYCGDDDGHGGVCTDQPCRVVGTDLANPSPCGPSQQDSPWQTLDSAGCVNGQSCRIWCPYEKCDGCPNGTEAVWVPTSVDSYEQACHDACVALGACWDTALSLCRNPGACGTPLGQCPWE